MAGAFRPRFIQQTELTSYGLPDVNSVPNIMALIESASVLVDEVCGRIDGNGNGSLVYSTCSERLLMQSPNRNIVRTMFKPLVALTPAVVSNLQASGAIAGQVNCYDTGILPNTVVRPDGTLSSIIAASGRYGYPRRGQQAIYPDLNYGMNLLMVAAYFGGPPGWSPIDAGAIDWDSATGECWLPAGIYMSQYTEIVITYNTGWNPLSMPNGIKQATVAVVKNALSRGGGTTGLRSMSGKGMVNVTFSDDLIDPTVERWLDKFKNVIAL